MWRGKEAYTPTAAFANDNDANYVTVTDASGRGILESVTYSGSITGAVTLRVTIDALAVINGVEILHKDAGEDIAVSIPMAMGFRTSCKVELKNGGITTARYGVIMNVE